MITALGLVVDTLPQLHKLPIGGRLTVFGNAWQILTENHWVHSIVRVLDIKSHFGVNPSKSLQPKTLLCPLKLIKF